MMNHQIISNRTSASRSAHRANGIDSLILSAMVMFGPLAIIAMSIVCNSLR